MKKKLIIIFLFFFVAIFITLRANGAFILNKKVYFTGTSGKIGNPMITLSYVNDENEYVTIDNLTPGYNNGLITCYATKKQVFNSDGFVELKNLNVSIEYTSAISTKLRIKIQDEWKSYKEYTSGTKKYDIISKDVTKSPFNIDENFDYNNGTGYAYYSEVINAGKNTITFITPNDYTYELETGYGYRETILVSLQFQVDIVQANRAEEIWKI